MEIWIWGMVKQQGDSFLLKDLHDIIKGTVYRSISVFLDKGEYL